LTHICFTDHVDFNPTEDGSGLFDYDRYTAAIDRAQAEFEGRIHILKGIEFGEPHLYVKEYQELLRKDFDVIIASVHFVRMDIGLHWFEDDGMFREYTRQNLYRQYYEDLLQVVRLGGFDVLAHFDNPKRYLPESGQETELIDEIMHELVSRKLVIEVNTSPLRRGCQECAPDSRILKQYTGAGGTRVTVGSDAHSTQEIAAGFDYAEQLARDHGLRMGYFQGRQFIAT
jgi:histidinol-phosphatase (PHP family)